MALRREVVGPGLGSVSRRLQSLRRGGRLPPVPRQRPHPVVSAEEPQHARTHILDAVCQESIICLECGTLYRSLGHHTPSRHGLRAKVYRMSAATL